MCRERAATRPQGLSSDAGIAGAALQPFRDTRQLLQRTAYRSEHHAGMKKATSRVAFFRSAAQKS
ncbi:hypothetical protein CMV24_05445 [Pseudomonas plecoglossicida]|uniref:Uncharacterized protein n=1 Tax=Pseudomonas plecoglossicida TaxID=70775 RepID=A0A2A3M804_PSEDL|nr:hypothetical protein CMV24_05445 [Pseudomonas plecoglossicida]